jgi:hypothetical protein
MSDFNQQDASKGVKSTRVKAGKRTYFFDIKCTNYNDHYLVITESKKKHSMGFERPMYIRSQIFLYKEDLEKFVNGLQQSIDYIKSQYPDMVLEKTRMEEDDYNNHRNNDH